MASAARDTRDARRATPRRAMETSFASGGANMKAVSAASLYRDSAAPAQSSQGEVVDRIEDIERAAGAVTEQIALLAKRLDVILRPEPPSQDGDSADAAPLPATAISELLTARVRELHRMRRILSSVLDRLALP